MNTTFGPSHLPRVVMANTWRVCHSQHTEPSLSTCKAHIQVVFPNVKPQYSSLTAGLALWNKVSAGLQMEYAVTNKLSITALE